MRLAVKTQLSVHLICAFAFLCGADQTVTQSVSSDKEGLTMNDIDSHVSTIWPRIEPIVWPEDTNKWYISREPDAIYNYQVRDEMERRIEELQTKINQGVGLTEKERKQLGMKILENYQTQRLMREMQRSLDRGELTDKEHKQVKDKLKNLVMEINAGGNPVVIETDEADKLQSFPLKKRPKRSYTTLSSTPHFSTTTSSTPPLTSETTTATPKTKKKSQSKGQKNHLPVMEEYKTDPNKLAMVKNLRTKFRKVFREKAERDMMGHMLRAGIKGVSPIDDNKGKASSAPRKRRNIPTKLDKPADYKPKNMCPMKDGQNPANVQEMSTTLEETIHSFFDGVPITKTVYEFFAEDAHHE